MVIGVFVVLLIMLLIRNGIISTLDMTSKDVIHPIENQTTVVSNTTVEDICTPVTPINNTNKTGLKLENARFAVCSSYWEQQTNALLNMWSFQKWANFTGFKTLEPFAGQSVLGFTDQILQDYNFTNVLRFRDYFDLDFWTNMTKENYGIPPLNEWNKFALSPLKKTVIVILVHKRRHQKQ